MKIILVCFCSLLILSAASQSTVSKTFPVKAGETVELNFDYPKVVRVSTWDKNEVSVVAKVSINGGQNDDAFVLEDKSTNGTVSIRNKINNLDNLPRRYTVIEGGKKTVFNSKEDLQQYKKTSSGSHTMYSEGVDMEITVEVKVPANTNTDIKSTYGMVELVDFNGPANVNAPYGGIDATVVQASTGKLQATTSYGQIYSNLDLKITDKTERDFYTSITAEPGKGSTYILKSTYGKIYLRKP
jgi:hypothetical protein